MLLRFPAASCLDAPDLRALVLKAVAWGPPGETLSTVAAKLLHGELLGYALASDGRDDPLTETVGVLEDPVIEDHHRGPREGQPPLLLQSLRVAHRGIALLEFDPLGIVMNIAYLAAGRDVLGPFLDELAALAGRYGFRVLECYSRRPGMGRLLTRHDWVEAEPRAAQEPAPGFRRFVLPVARAASR